MSKFKRIIAFFCAASCMLALPGCTKKDTPAQSESVPSKVIEEVKKSDEVLRIALNKADGVNPYISNTNLTMQAAALTFTNMVDINASMEAVYSGVSEVRKNGLEVTIVPKEAFYFADGTSVTSADIAACLNTARTSAAYSGQFANIEKVEEVEGRVIVTLYTPDSFFEYLLTIPVIKADELLNRYPVSSGRYTADENGFTLNALAENSGALPKIIETVPLSGFDEIVSALGIGELSLYYTEAENSSASSTTSLQNFFKMNNLVFLGINSQRGEDSFFANAAARIAVSEMLDRQVLADKCYYQRAYPALGAVNSFYPCVATKQLISPNAQAAQAVPRMEGMGYKKNALDGYYEKNLNRCTVSLLVYSGSTYKRYAANFIKETLAQNGIYVNIEETDNFEVYKQKIVNGEFDMYIGEVKLYNNMDLSVFLNANEKSSMFFRSEELLAAYAAMRENERGAVEFEKLFAEQMPYIPLVWRMGTLVTKKTVHGIIPTLSNIFYDMSSFSLS